MPGQGGCVEEEEEVVKGKTVAATAFEGTEGGMRKPWYLSHLFTYVFLIWIIFRQQIGWNKSKGRRR